MNKPKYLLFDMDGTLLNSDHRINKATLEALEKAQEKGIKVSIATGRSFQLTIDTIKEINANDYAIICNGGMIWDINKKEIIPIAKPFSKEFKEYFFEQVKKLQSGFLAYSKINSYFFSHSKESKLVFKPYMKGSLDLSNLGFEKMKEVIMNEEIYNFSHQSSLMHHDDFIMLFKEYKEDKKMCNMSSALDGVVDIYGYNINKAKGFLKFCELTNINKEDVYYFGDSMNDYEIAQLIPNSVAMGNGIAKLKEVTKFQIGDNNSTAIADFIWKLIEN